MHIFGFLNAAGLTEQNIGLLDQRLAYVYSSPLSCLNIPFQRPEYFAQSPFVQVEWIRDNIASFEGDPTKMTLWRQSAGAASVDIYNYADPRDPIVKGLLMDSGSASLIATAEPTYSIFIYVASTVGYRNMTADAELSCMRNVPMTALMQAVWASLSTGSLRTCAR